MAKKSTPRVMSKFEKVIVTEGNYKQKKNGKDYIRHVSKEDLKQAEQTFNKMKEAGLKVPAPWKHDFDITAFNKIEEGNSGLLEDSTRNAGFWDSVVTRVNAEGKLQLVGTIEAPGDKNDPNTPAGKIGTLVKDTSIYMRDNFVDGSGNNWDKALMHIALVTHPIEPGQENFSEGDTYIAMSELVADDANLTELATKCKNVLGIYIPPNTTMDNLVGNLMIAINQYELLNEESDDTQSKNPITFKSEPMIMSDLTQEQIDVLVKTNAINPATKKPFSPEDFAAKPDSKKAKKKDEEVVMSQGETALLMSMMETNNRNTLRNRIDRLVETRRITKDVADARLYPKLDSYKLQHENGTIVMSSLEVMIEDFEANEPKKAETQSTKGEEVIMDLFGEEDDAKDMDAVADQMLKYL